MLTVVGVVLVALAHLALGRQWLAVDLVAAAFAVPLVLVDLRERRLPDALTLGGFGAVVGVVAVTAAADGDLGRLAGALAGAAAMAGVLLVLHLVSPSGMGFGDVKLGLMLGAVVGCRTVGGVMAALFVAGVAGAVAGLYLSVRHRRRGVTLAFGPCLVLGAAAAVALHAGG